SSDDVAETFDALLREMQLITSRLTTEDWAVLKTIMTDPNGQLRVDSIFDGFERETPAHELMRKLREAQFVRPANGGRWKNDSIIQIKPFGKLM
ncbi:MAG TPA: hypothetical protein PK264_22215, partial [Hyphomicrobiaceae bacterium]|nr:hypothetical protein [Hyphomicrobiaceae bacterium]